ncbi:MAG: PQQ-binding-like beta-propeller repeat protein [Planctomycetota bacterium]|nr:PQQ-binding-like beta-propeller repeat protein [Planctomycetota bacterium]
MLTPCLPQKSKPFFSILLATFGTVFTSFTSAEDWPQFRGPKGNGIVDQINHPLEWDSKTNIAWQHSVPGGGLSSPIVIGQRIFVTSAVGADLPFSFAKGVSNMRPKRPAGPVKFHVSCLSLANGEKLWEKTLSEERPKHPIHSSNSFATESPCSDGKKLFVYFAAIGKLYALDFDGKLIWQKDLGSFPTGNGFGTGSSITCGQGRVFVQCDNDRASFVVALDAATGAQKWQSKRSSRTSWATPMLWNNNNRLELITCGSGFVTSYDPNTGETYWKLTGLGSSFSASPAADAERIYFGTSGPLSSGPLVAVGANLSGEMAYDKDTDNNRIWFKKRSGPGMPSPIASNGCVYIPSRNVLTCYDAKNGEVHYKQRIPLKSMAASLWGDKQHFLMMDESGKTLVIRSGPKYELVQTNQIDDLFWSTPAVAGDALVLRGVKNLYCVRKPK